MPRIPTATSAADLHQTLATYRAASTYHAERIKLAEVDAGMFVGPYYADTMWQRQRNGDVARGDGLFFEVTGVRIFPTGTQGNSYDQPIMAEPTGGIVALVCDRETGDVLVDMKAEPGTSADLAHITFAPTLQTSQGRLHLAAQAHRDMAPTLVSALVGLGLPHDDAMFVHQDGGRFWGKRNAYDVVMTPNKRAVDALGSGSMVWTKVAYLASEENRDELNCHLMQALAAHALLGPERH